MADDLSSFARRVVGVDARMKAADAAGVSVAARVVQQNVNRQASSKGVGGSKLARVGVSTAGRVATVKMLDRKAHLLERDTKAHPITAGYTKAQIGKALAALFGQTPKRRFSTRSRKQAVVWQGASHPVTSVDHPGTKGKHIFWGGVDNAGPDITKAYGDAMSAAVASLIK
jgi:hypothetical protein